SPAVIPQAIEHLDESDFWHRGHRLIYRAITALHGDGKPSDAVTLGEWFEANNLSDQLAGGAGYLIELASNTPSAANALSYIEIVRDRATSRRIIEVGTEIVN